MRRWIVPVILSLSVLTAHVSFAQVADGDKAARAKDWAGALKAYETANQSSPSAEALEGIANAHYNLKNDGPAYAAYAEWLQKYGDKTTPAKKGQATARLKELEGKTGPLTIDVNEKDAVISVDDVVVGKSPLSAPVRLGAGPHRVRVTKDGFVTFDGAPNVVVGTPGSLTVKLEAASTTGKLSVKEKTGKPIRVVVDGKDMGDAPWNGEVPAGEHEVSGKSPTMAAPAQKITVERGKEASVELAAVSTSAPLRISTNDGKGLIYVDDKLVGEGTFAGDLPAGPHKIRITREGYDPYEEDVTLVDKTPAVRSVALKLSSKIETGPVQKVNRALEGFYGGFQFMGHLTPGGWGSSPEKLCDADDKPKEVASCDTGSGLGGGFGAFFGHHWDPIGVELFALGQYDQLNPSVVWNASSVDGGIGPDPARTADFKLRRAGGVGAARIRYTAQGEKLRFSAAAGVGLSFRTIFLERDTTATRDPSQTDKLVSDGAGYTSFALSIEPSIQYRLTEGIAPMLGLSMLLDSPTSLGSDVPRTTAENQHRLGTSGLSSPAYDLASGTQLWMGVFLGMMFGP